MCVSDGGAGTTRVSLPIYSHDFVDQHAKSRKGVEDMQAILSRQGLESCTESCNRIRIVVAPDVKVCVLDGLETVPQPDYYPASDRDSPQSCAISLFQLRNLT